ncbi:DUF835 domain-containing protein [Thermococcus sp. M39]|uniref:DUF835 domain-containing protein n=1 Tax=unclassified Thermococcus TaxID=2627626 RepID=UPI00143CB204|nr:MULTISPECIES: DUF835 domain-containing protein [unclassified Thermococcus]NJE07934.1 DUF835 domain-containing protein [Thermococcus sp. M39]NJE13632.1 DUF835 domain-containing protein [Thermococcus sp. LS2]
MFRILRSIRSADSEHKENYPTFRVVHYSEVPEILEKVPRRKKILITRTPPNGQNSSVLHIWISKVDHPSAVSPSNLYVIEQKVWELLNRDSPIIVFDAFEYLMMEQGLEAALKFTGKLRDMALLNNSGFIVSVSEGLDERVVALLKRIVEG